MAYVIVAVLYATATAWLAWHRGPHAAVIMLMLSGLLQPTLVTVFKSEALSVGDDAAGLVVLALGAFRIVRRRSKPDLVAAGVATLWAVLCLVAFVRCSNFGVGAEQARQVIFPVGLALCGFSLRKEIRWPKVLDACLVLAAAASVYALVEWVKGAPLIDPTYFNFGTAQPDPDALKAGLPSAYVSDTQTGVIIRAGGPFLNPPSLGYFLAAGVISSLLAGFLLPNVLLAAGLAAAFARAGIVMTGMSTAVAACWHYLGRLVSTVLIIAAALALTVVFLGQGNTASHARGLLDGLAYAIVHPLGQGFGEAGYQAALVSASGQAAGAESLLGLYFAWFGLPAVVAVVAGVGWLVTILRRSKLSSVQAWAALSVVVGAAVSETSSSLSATAFLWLMLGASMGLQDLRNPRSGGARWTDLAWSARLLRRGRAPHKHRRTEKRASVIV